MTELDYFIDIQFGLERQGPGDNDSTQLALNCLKNLPDEITLLDIGCGPGMQTVFLAKNINGKVTALDFYEIFLNQLRESIKKENLEDKIFVLNKSMFEMDFPDECFDVIWSEGAIYIYGFEKALKDWKRFIKPNGYLVCSHISWFKKNPPEEIVDYWKSMYEDIRQIEINLATAKECGYEIVNYFNLPDESWWNDYYAPLLGRLPKFKLKYVDNKTAKKVINEIEIEIEMFKKYSEYYGYVFYILKKNQS